MRKFRLLLMPLVVAVAAAGFTLVPNVAAHADYCPFQSLKHDAVVRENPDTNSKVLKHKKAGEIVTMPCWSRGIPIAVLDPESGVTFDSVNCDCASDGIGWIRGDAFN